MPRIQYSLLVVFIAFSTTGCLESLEWDYEDRATNSIVIEGGITSAPGPQRIVLRRTQDVIVEGPGPGETGAEVQVSDGTTSWVFHHTGEGVYESDSAMTGRPGETYFLTVEVDGTEYEAEAFMPKAIPLQPIELSKWTGDFVDSNDTRYALTYRSNFGVPAAYNYIIELTIPSNVSDNYHEGWEMPDWMEEVLSTPDRILIDSTYYLHPGLEPPALFAYGESTYAGFPIGTICKETFYSMSQEHYAFIRAMLSETEWRGLGPFGYVPADVPGNISNGAYGYFWASDIAVVEQIAR